MAAIETAILLASGARLPTLGLGVYQTLDPGRTTTAALAAGYRHVDSARIYRNEERCGQAVAAWLAEHPDERVFLTSKITGKEHGTARTRVAVDESVARLSALGLRWDLFLLHDATSGAVRRLEAWRVLEETQQQGKLLALGVSNFSEVHLEEFVAAGVSTPEVNQIELHPFNQQRRIVAYCQAHGIVVQAYCPLVRGTRFDDPVLQAVASETGKSPAQILIRWSLQKGYVPLPKSDTPSRIVENANVYDFSLSPSQMARLDALDEGAKVACSWNPVAHA